MHIKKWTGLGTIVLIIFLIGFAVFSQINSLNSAKTLRIGALIPLTGKFAHYGEDIKNALELGKKYLQDTKAMKIQIIYEDSAADPKIAVPAVVKLIDIEKVSFVIGGPGSSANLAAAPLFEKKGVPFFPVSNAPRLKEAGKYIFRMLSSIYPELDAVLPELKSAHINRLAIIYDSASDTQVLGKEYLEKIFTQAGENVAFSEGYDSKSSTDFRTILAKVKSTHPDAIYLFSVDKDAGTIVRQAHELGLTIPFYGWESQNTAEFFRTAGNTATNVTITDVPFSCENSSSEQVLKYCSDYKTTYANRSPLMFGARAYDTLLLGASFLRYGGENANSEQFIEDMTHVREYKGISGTLDVDVDGNVEDKIFLIRTVRNGAFIQK